MDNMECENTYSSVNILFLKQFDLSNFCFEKPALKRDKR